MKKLFTLFVFLFSLMALEAHNLSWDKEVEIFLEEFQDETKEIENEFTSMGLEVNVSCGYDKEKRQILLDVRFQEAIWKLFDANMMKEAKQDMIEEYKKSYKSDEDFANFINDMKKNNAVFLIAYTALKDGKVLSKDFIITPQEIIN